jgi:predicted transcriptional regulator
MNNEDGIHAVQANILYTLRAATRARYSELLRPTNLEGDRFKYHLAALVRKKLVFKAIDGVYELTAEGKEFANRLDESTGREIAGPKASMLLVVRSLVNGEIYYLAHKRTREPFRDYWGIASAPLLRGLLIRDAAARELKKQTGIVADFTVAGMQRLIDKLSNGAILEDKLFTVLLAEVKGLPEAHRWSGGESIWLTREELLAKPRLFHTTQVSLDMIEQGLSFSEEVCIYDKSEY